MLDEYKFPDEKEDKEKVDDEIELEFEDDTPTEDRNKDPLPEEVREELYNDELEDYSTKVKKKLIQMKKLAHDERREKDAARREQDEAVELAKRVIEENKRLKSTLNDSEKNVLSSIQRAVDLELEAAKRAYREAYDSGDADKLLEAQKELMRAEMKLDKAKNFKPTVQIPENEVQTTQKQPAQQQMDPKVSAWVSENQWFVNPSKRGMRRYAEGVHEELAERYGQAFVGTDEYFKGIDKEVRKRFPEEFASEQNVDDDKPQRTRPSTVVAPAKRSTAPKKITLSKTQVGVAKKLGISPEQYARELAKMEN